MRERRPFRRCALLGLTALGLGALCLPPATPLLVYNASASVARGFYLTHTADALARGDLVLLRLPDSIRAFAAARGYLPTHLPLIKPVAALPDDHVCVVSAHVFIDGKPVAALLPSDRAGRPLPAWRGCRALQDGEVFLLALHADGSFDSRYFGPVERTAVLARLVPLWTW